jgi:uncharacterized protein YabE (DUF348 family)
MRKTLKQFNKRYNVANHPKVRTIRRISQKPLFTVPFATFMALLAIVAAGLFLFADGKPQLREGNPNVVVVTYDKQERTIPTDAKNVGELLKRMEIKLNTGDVVEPGQKTEIASDNFRVNVYRAVPVTIVDGAKKTFTYSAASTPRSIVKQAGVEVYPEDNLNLMPTENFLEESSIGERVVIDRATAVEVNLYGTQATIRTHAKTVAELIKEKNIRLGKDDDILPAGDTPLTPGSQVFLIRKGTQVQTVEEAVAMPTESVEDESLAYGTAAIRQQGSPGKKLVTYQIELKNGVEVGRKPIQEVVTQQPVAQVVAKGSRPLTISLQTWLYKLRMCESGGNYQTNTGNGFYGAYQFMQSTWNNIAKRVRPDLVGVSPHVASPADQDFMIITNTNMTAGLKTQNPGCYKSTGISNYPPANH